MTTTLECFGDDTVAHAVHAGRLLCGLVDPSAIRFQPHTIASNVLLQGFKRCDKCLERAPGVVRMIERAKTAHPPGAVIPF